MEDALSQSGKSRNNESQFSDKKRFHNVFSNSEKKRITDDKSINHPKRMIDCSEENLRAKLGDANICAKLSMIPYADKVNALYFWALYDDVNKETYIHTSVMYTIVDLLDEYTNASRYYINGKKCHSNTQEKYIGYLREYYGSMVLAKVRDCKSKKVSYFLIGDADFDRDNKKHFYSYTDTEAREVLAACYVFDRFRGLRIGRRQFELVNEWYASRSLRYSLGGLIPDDVLVVPDSIYLTHLIGYDEILILVYSNFTDCFECIEAKIGEEGEVWISRSIYQGFKEKHKRITANVTEIEDEQISDKELKEIGKNVFHNLASESILMKHGYSVNAIENLSKTEREKVLAQILDEKIVTRKNLIARLEFYIRCHSDDRNMIARTKWAEDIDYVKQYRS